MGSTSGAGDFVFPPGQVYHSSSVYFITDTFGKISLLVSDSNHSGRATSTRPRSVFQTWLRPTKRFRSGCAYARSGSGPREVGIIIQHMDDYYSITDNLEYSNSFDDYSRDTIYDNDIDDLVPIFEVFMAAIAGPEDDKAAAAWLARELAKEQARREDDRR
uniref:Retrotransposon protein, putative, Ty3-gypsy subclass n=2 Tax=Oryza sativa subsp. japonica TaxID=39947 RepID=Q53L04_ORYSJ|nr:retrotransposon protein, putative, Ty3-gypsy sub-class [Oryza sativa Japonica Group]ABA92551.1 retrotransposon protein, putative, Ty3-gypsy subclass [Oryza sativa Japonica Group]